MDDQYTQIRTNPAPPLDLPVDDRKPLISIRDLKVHFDLGFNPKFELENPPGWFKPLSLAAGILLGLLVAAFFLWLIASGETAADRLAFGVLIAVVAGLITGYVAYKLARMAAVRIHAGKKAHNIVKAVDGVTLDIYPGETLGLVGESGCGKSTLGRAILRLTEPTSGHTIFRGKDLAHLSKKEMRRHRQFLQMIFQDPYASLNPRMTVGQIIGEPIETFHLAPEASRPIWLRALGWILAVAAAAGIAFMVWSALQSGLGMLAGWIAEGIGGDIGPAIGRGVHYLVASVPMLIIGMAVGYLVYYLVVYKTTRILMAAAGGLAGYYLAVGINSLLLRSEIDLGEDYLILKIVLTVLFSGSGLLLAMKVWQASRTFGGMIDRRVQDLMETVGLSKRFITRYPHEFSGGQRQRIGIARALAVEPNFVVADEPISALDVSIQAQIMNLMEELQQKKDLTYLFISHDLRAIRHVSDRVAVMYLGKLVEVADAKTIYARPLMPYTKALISAVPVPDPEIELTRKRMVLEGDVPSPINPPEGCRFHTRCPYVVPACREVVPPLVEITPNHLAACIRISPDQPDIEKVAPGDTPGLRYAETAVA